MPSICALQRAPPGSAAFGFGPSTRATQVPLALAGVAYTAMAWTAKSTTLWRTNAS